MYKWETSNNQQKSGNNKTHILLGERIGIRWRREKKGRDGLYRQEEEGESRRYVLWYAGSIYNLIVPETFFLRGAWRDLEPIMCV